MPVNPNYKEFSTYTSTVKSHVEKNQYLYGSKSLSKVLTKNITDSDGNELTGKEFIGRIFKNLGDVLHVKFAHLMSSFSDAKWVGNKVIRTALSKKIRSLTNTVNRQVSDRAFHKEEKEILKSGVAEMEAVCKILKDRGVRNIDTVINQLAELDKTINETKSKESKSPAIGKKIKEKE